MKVPKLGALLLAAIPASAQSPAIDPTLRQNPTLTRSHLYRPDYTHLYRKATE